METKFSKLLNWLKDSDQFKISNAIDVIDTSDSGRGVYLQKPERLKRNDILISIPSNFQLNFHSVLYHISKFNQSLRIPGITIDDDTNITDHSSDQSVIDPRFSAYSLLNQDFLLQLTSFQLLSLYILAEWVLLPEWSRNSNTHSFWKPFFDVWPTCKELGSIPTVWNCRRSANQPILYKKLIKLLPYASLSHMSRISLLVEKDWQVILPIIRQWNVLFPTGLSIDDQFNQFLHIYFIINSRCLYCNIPIKKDSEDKIVSNFTMVPLVDFLNHSDIIDKYCYPQVNELQKTQCGVGQFMIRVGEYEYQTSGEQIFLNYGPHSNDFLLNEYGFTIPNNKWDFIDISEEIEQLLKVTIVEEEERNNVVTFLKENDYWGDYTLNIDEISFRTIVALSLIITKDFRRIEKFMQGYISEDYFIPKVQNILESLLGKIKLDAQKKSHTLTELLGQQDDSVTKWYIQNLITIFEDYIKIIHHHVG